MVPVPVCALYHLGRYLPRGYPPLAKWQTVRGNLVVAHQPLGVRQHMGSDRSLRSGGAPVCPELGEKRSPRLQDHVCLQGVVHKHCLDFLIRLATGKMFVLEVKGQGTQQNKAKREFLAEWLRPSTSMAAPAGGHAIYRSIRGISAG